MAIFSSVSGQFDYKEEAITFWKPARKTIHGMSNQSANCKALIQEWDKTKEDENNYPEVLIVVNKKRQ